MTTEFPMLSRRVLSRARFPVARTRRCNRRRGFERGRRRRRRRGAADRFARVSPIRPPRVSMPARCTAPYGGGEGGGGGGERAAAQGCPCRGCTTGLMVPAGCPRRNATRITEMRPSLAKFQANFLSLRRDARKTIIISRDYFSQISIFDIRPYIHQISDWILK